MLPESSSDDPKPAARLCMLRLWVSLLFISANRVTYKMEIIDIGGQIDKEGLKRNTDRLMDI